jgi:hypothetical protein
MITKGRLCRLRHPGRRLGAEVLDDDFLNMFVTTMEITQGQK